MAQAKKNTTSKAKAAKEETQPVAEEPEAPVETPAEESKEESQPIATEPEETLVPPQQAPPPVQGRWVQAKGVLYTDGLSGAADQNLERAYEYNERLQSNDPEVRKAGDESLSESALEARDDKDAEEARAVSEGERG